MWSYINCARYIFTLCSNPYLLLISLLSFPNIEHSLVQHPWKTGILSCSNDSARPNPLLEITMTDCFIYHKKNVLAYLSYSVHNA